MVFLRPVVMCDAETTNRIWFERYDQIRGLQKAMQPNSSVLVPINESPVIPPLRLVEEADHPLSAPQSSPGTTRPTLRPGSDSTAPPPPPPASAPASTPSS